jgi:hypothetical protein
MTRISAAGVRSYPYGQVSHIASVPLRCELGQNLPRNWQDYLRSFSNSNIRCAILDLRFSQPVLIRDSVFLRIPGTEQVIALADLIYQVKRTGTMQPFATTYDDNRPLILINLDQAAVKNNSVRARIKAIETSHKVRVQIDTQPPLHGDYEEESPSPGQPPMQGYPIAKSI